VAVFVVGAGVVVFVCAAAGAAAAHGTVSAAAEHRINAVRVLFMVVPSLVFFKIVQGGEEEM
jgi:hypothetical protein